MPDVPVGAKQPQDHKPPARREADGDETAVVEWRDEKWTLPASVEDWDQGLLELFEDGKAVKAVRSLLGAEQYRRFKSAHPKVRDLNSFAEVVADLYGFESLGE